MTVARAPPTNNQRKKLHSPATETSLHPADFAVGSVESRAAARAMAEREPSTVIRVRIVHIGRTDSEGLPPPKRVLWEGGATDIVHVAGTPQ